MIKNIFAFIIGLFFSLNVVSNTYAESPPFLLFKIGQSQDHFALGLNAPYFGYAAYYNSSTQETLGFDVGIPAPSYSIACSKLGFSPWFAFSWPIKSNGQTVAWLSRCEGDIDQFVLVLPDPLGHPDYGTLLAKLTLL